MKKMNKYMALVAGTMMIAGTLHAQVVNVDFQPGGVGAVYSTNYTGQGAHSDPGNDLWNIAAPNTTFIGTDEAGGWFSGGYTLALTNSDGTASGMSLFTQDGDIFGFNPSNSAYADFADDAKDLMSDYLQIPTFSRAVFIEGLETNQAYKLYLYGGGQWDRDMHFAVRCATNAAVNWGYHQWVGDAQTYSTTGPHNLTELVDYVTFAFVTGPDMDTLWIEYNAPSDIGAFNGLQLVKTATLEAKPQFLGFPGSQTVEVGTPMSLDITATNEFWVNDVILLSTFGDLPDGATFDPIVGTNGVTGTLNWTPTESGWQTIAFVAEGSNGVTSASITFNVQTPALMDPVEALLNLDFQPGLAGVAGGGRWSINYTGQGALSDPGNDAWNSVDPLITDFIKDFSDESGGWFYGGTFTGLVDSAGAPSGLTLSMPTNYVESFAHPTNNANYWVFANDAKDLMADYFIVFGQSRSLFIENLTPGTTYELCLYGFGQWNRDTQFSVRCDTNTNMNYGTAQWIGSKRTDMMEIGHDLTENVDYVRFNFTPDASNDVLWIEYSNAPGSDSNPFNGLQLAAMASATPAPVINMTMAGESVVLSWTNGASYNVLTNDDLAGGSWGVAIPSTPSPATNSGSATQLFFMLSE